MDAFPLNEEQVEERPIREVTPPPINKTAKLLQQLIDMEIRQTKLLKELINVQTPTIVELATVNRYKTFIINLATARTNVAVGIHALGVVAKFIMWDKVEAPLTYRINSKGHDEIVATVGDQHSDWDIEEVYVTNVASAGKEAILYIEWRK